MSDALGAIGKLFSGANLGKTLSAGTVGMGEIGNLLAGRQASQQSSALQKQQDAITKMTPAQLTANVQAGEAPINQGLVQSVNNSVQGDMASRGLAQAPGIFAGNEAQALAPFEQQNYQVALEQYLQKLGLPLSYAAQIKQLLPGQQNMTPAIQMLLQQLAKKSPVTPPTPTAPPQGSTFGDSGGLSPDLFSSPGVTA